MTLRETKQLQCGDRFRRPQGDRWREYTVTGRTMDASGLYGKKGAVLALGLKDERGHYFEAHLLAWKTAKTFMASAERIRRPLPCPTELAAWSLPMSEASR